MLLINGESWGERILMETSYGKMRRSDSWKQTRTNWGLLATWKHFAVPAFGVVVAVIVLIATGGWAPMHIALSILIAAVGSYALYFLGSLVIQYVWMVPESMHEQQIQLQAASLTEQQDRHSKAVEKLNEQIQASRIEAAESAVRLREEIRVLTSLHRAEVAKNARPEIVGRDLEFSTGIYGDGMNGMEPSAGVDVHFSLRITNIRPVPTNLDEVRLDGTALPVPAEFQGVDAWEVPPPTANGAPDHHPNLLPGISFLLAGRARLQVDGYRWKDLGETLDLTGLVVELIDGFGVAHRIPVEEGTRISVG